MLTIPLIHITLLSLPLTTALTPQNPSLPLPPSLTTPPTATSTCYIPGGNIHHPALLSDCYTAIRLVLADRSILLPQRFSARYTAPFTISVPFTRQYRSCIFVLDTRDATEVQEFLLVRAAYYAAELVQPCVAMQKVPLGGKTGVDVGGFFVGVIGAPVEMQGVGNGTVEGLVRDLRRL